MSHAVIVQNKGGGHGEIGFHLAKRLRAMDFAVTLLQDKAASSAKLPFSCYTNDLAGCNVVWCDPTNKAEVEAAVAKGGPITHVWDNFAKGLADVEAVMGVARASEDFQMYSYVSSAGMYTSKGHLKEHHSVKDPPTGQREVELLLSKKLAGRWCSFRPQYIYGPQTNKRDYLDWFLLRVSQDLPLPIPGDGSQPVSVTHCEDVASIMASVVGKETEAAGQLFNCGTDRLVTYEEICRAAAEGLGKTATVVKLPEGTKTSFPFRPNAQGFFVRPTKAQKLLGWKGAKHYVLTDLSGFYTKDFQELGLADAAVDTSKDGL